MIHLRCIGGSFLFHDEWDSIVWMNQFWLSDKESACSAGDAGDAGSVPGLGRSPGGGHGNPPQYSCLENPMDRGAWWATVHGVAKSRTRLERLSTHAPVCLSFHLFKGICVVSSFRWLQIKLLTHLIWRLISLLLYVIPPFLLYWFGWRFYGNVNFHFARINP